MSVGSLKRSTWPAICRGPNSISWPGQGFYQHLPQNPWAKSVVSLPKHFRLMMDHDISETYHDSKITLLRVIPTMTSIRFVTGKSSGILSGISSGILSGISSGILSGISSGILPGISSAICSGISSGTLSGISSGISSDILSGILSGKSSGDSIWQTFWHFIWHIFWHSIWHSIWHTFWHSIRHIFWHSIWQTFWHFIWHIFWRSIWHIFWHSIWPLRASGAHWARRAPGWGPAVLTELGGSEVEVQRCSLSSDGPRLRSSGAHWARTLAVEVQQCPLRAEVGE